MTNLTSIVGKIEKLRKRTVDKGASPHEADTTALILGRLVMAHPALVVSVGHSPPKPEPPPEPEYREWDPDWIFIPNCEFLHKTEKAYLYRKDDVRFWIPKSLVDLSQTGPLLRKKLCEICMKRWFWEKEIEPKFQTCGK